MKTQLEYLTDTYLFESTATVLEVYQEDEKKIVIFDKTIFYPQGGGQPSDIGFIKRAGTELEVKKVIMNEEGVVLHRCVLQEGALNIGDKVTLLINKEVRRLHAKLHSAGHIIDCAMHDLQMDSLAPTKGFHFKEGPYIEYRGIIKDIESFIPKLEKALRDIINTEHKVHVSTAAKSVQSNIGAPKGKDMRLVRFGSYDAVGCGGTHVQSTAEIESITIRKIKNKKGNVKISYTVL